MQKVAAARPAGGAAAEADSIPAAAAEYREEVSEGRRKQRAATHSRASGHVYM